jgi:hypothetical protein
MKILLAFGIKTNAFVSKNPSAFIPYFIASSVQLIWSYSLILKKMFLLKEHCIDFFLEFVYFGIIMEEL